MTRWLWRSGPDVVMVPAHAHMDPGAPPADGESHDFDDADEGADDTGTPITSVGGSERLIWRYLGRR